MDVYATIPAQWVLVVASLIGAGLIAYQMTVHPPLAVHGGDRSLCRRFVARQSLRVRACSGCYVAPNEQVREMPFIQHSIAATRAAFALDTVEERSISGDATLTPGGHREQRATLENVPLWNDQPLLDTFGQIRKSAPATTSFRSTTTATRSTASTARSCCRRAS